MMAVAAVEIYYLGLALLEEGMHSVMGALPCRKCLLPTSQVCWSDMLEKAWTKRVWEFSRGLTGTIFPLGSK